MYTRNSFDHLFHLYLEIGGAVFLLVMAVLLFGVVRYRAGRGHEPSRKAKHDFLESLTALCLVGMACFLAVTAASANAAERGGLGKPQLKVAITAFQWCWSFHYDGTPVTVRGNCSTTTPTLVVPTGEVIRFSLMSADVVHEWWLPYADYKEEAFPDHRNFFKLRFGSTGHWEGRCDEFCGLYHDRMDFYVVAKSPRAFDRWLAEERHRAARAAA